MKSTARILFLVATTLGANVALADGESQSGSNGTSFSLALTIGEGMYFIDGDVYRGPASLEVVPSIGWPWVKLDLGLSTTLESIQIAETSVGYWNFTFRPGGRLTSPILPLYLRIAFPLQFQQDDFDWGVMFGVGVDALVFGNIGVVLEVDTTLSKYLEWGGNGVPLEFRAGLSLHF